MTPPAPSAASRTTSNTSGEDRLHAAVDAPASPHGHGDMLMASHRVPVCSRGAAARRTPRLGQRRDEYDVSRRADLSTTGGPTRPRHASSQPEPKHRWVGAFRGPPSHPDLAPKGAADLATMGAIAGGGAFRGPLSPIPVRAAGAGAVVDGYCRDLSQIRDRNDFGVWARGTPSRFARPSRRRGLERARHLSRRRSATRRLRAVRCRQRRCGPRRSDRTGPWAGRRQEAHGGPGPQGPRFRLDDRRHIRALRRDVEVAAPGLAPSTRGRLCEQGYEFCVCGREVSQVAGTHEFRAARVHCRSASDQAS
jgi:hypothetical protein